MTASEREDLRRRIDAAKRARLLRASFGAIDCDTPSLSSYRNGCRCRSCKNASRDDKQRRRERQAAA